MTTAILFFGTPHQGSLEADKWSPLASIINLAYGDMRSDLIKKLKVLSKELFSITQSFRGLSSSFGIISVYETKAVWGRVVSLSVKFVVISRNPIPLNPFSRSFLKSRP